MAGDSKEEVVLERRQVREFVDEELRHGFGVGAFSGDAVLRLLWEQFVWQFAEPSLEHGADDIDIVQIFLLK